MGNVRLRKLLPLEALDERDIDRQRQPSPPVPSKSRKVRGSGDSETDLPTTKLTHMSRESPS